MFYRTQSAGFTLLETLVVLALFTILSLAIMNAVSTFYRFNAYSIAQSAEVEQARRGVDQMVRDIREMTYADNGTFPLVTMGTSTIRFYSDIDRDDSVELVDYVLDDTTLYKYVYDATGNSYDTSSPDATFTISEFVQNRVEGVTMFTYYDETGSVITGGGPVTEARFVQMNIVVNIDPIRNPGEFTLRTSTALRNLINGL